MGNRSRPYMLNLDHFTSLRAHRKTSPMQGGAEHGNLYCEDMRLLRPKRPRNDTKRWFAPVNNYDYGYLWLYYGNFLIFYRFSADCW
jgi:hypothetical protein